MVVGPTPFSFTKAPPKSQQQTPPSFLLDPRALFHPSLSAIFPFPLSPKRRISFEYTNLKDLRNADNHRQEKKKVFNLHSHLFYTPNSQFSYIGVDFKGISFHALLLWLMFSRLLCFYLIKIQFWGFLFGLLFWKVMYDLVKPRFIGNCRSSCGSSRGWLTTIEERRGLGNLSHQIGGFWLDDERWKLWMVEIYHGEGSYRWFDSWAW